MKSTVFVVATLVSAAIVTGCTSYSVNIRTFPAAKADVYVDGKRLGQTTDEGRAIITTGKRSIFSEPLLEVRKGEQCASLRMAYAKPGTKINNVVRATSKEVGFERYYDVVIALIGNPLPPLKKELVKGSNALRVSNPNEFPVWVGVHSEEGGVDFIVFENASETVNLPDGSYDICFAYSTRPDELLQGGSVDLKGHGEELRTIKRAGRN